MSVYLYTTTYRITNDTLIIFITEKKHAHDHDPCPYDKIRNPV